MPSGTGTGCTTRSRTTCGGSSTRRTTARRSSTRISPRMFRAELFDAEKWADIFARSGAKYIVPTSKHHEGFCLWPSAEASRDWGRPWNAVEIGPKRDLMAELAAATRKRGLKFGFYYSLYEWYNPLWLSDRKRFVDEHIFPQFKDVVTRYQPADHLQPTANGTWTPRTGRARTAGLALQRVGLQGRSRGQRPLGQGLPAQARRLLDHGIRGRPEGRQPSLGGEPRHGLFLRLQPRRADRRLQDGPRVHPRALRPGQPRRQSAPGHRPQRRRHDPRHHGAAAAGDRRLAQGQRRGDLRHALRRPRAASGARASGPASSTASSW